MVVFFFVCGRDSHNNVVILREGPISPLKDAAAMYPKFKMKVVQIFYAENTLH